MRIVETHDPEVLRIDDDSFAVKLSGLGILLFSLSLWPIALQIEMANADTPSWWRLAAVLCVSMFIGSFGLMGMLFSGQTIIDRRLGKVVDWARLLRWKRKDVFPLKDFARVVVIRKNHRYGPTWHIQLLAKTTSRAKDVHCGIVSTEAEAQELAQRISTFSGTPLG